jgi:hypothetical protein
MGGIRIPKVLISKKRVKAHNPSQSNKSSKQTKPYVSLAELGIPSDLNLFKQSILHSSNGKFDTIAWTTLDEVKCEFFNIQYQHSWTDNEIKNELKKYKFRTERELWKQNSRLCYAAGRRGFLSHLPKLGSHNYLAKETLIKAQKNNVLIIDAAKSVGLEVHQYNRQLKYYGLFKAKSMAERNKQSSSKPVICFDKKGNKIKEYESASEAGRKLNIFITNIIANCNNKVKSAGGFVWKYKK